MCRSPRPGPSCCSRSSASATSEAARWSRAICRPTSGPPCSARRTCQNAPISEGIISEITITDPSHALCGRSFPLVSLRAERGRDYLVFGLPDGRQRTVRKSSTNLDAVEQEDHAREEFGLPRVSMRTLVPLARHLKTKFTSTTTAEVKRNARSPPADPTACVVFQRSVPGIDEGSAALAEPAGSGPEPVGHANSSTAV